jgi:hypothetical protein
VQYISQWLIGNMAFQLEAPDDFGEGAAKTAADPKGDSEAHPQMDTELETAEGNDSDDDNEVWGSGVYVIF